jgi:NAD(P)-dependent dehydrogenase (short-subunit alcohol dehydrogenase family)
MIKGPTVITGASRGIGRAIARRVAQDGGAVSLWARNSELLAQLAAELAETNAVPVDVQVVDVSDEDAVRAAAISVEDRLGPVRNVVNNAGVAAPGPFDELSVAAWDELFAVNARAVMLVISHTLPSMRRAGGGAYVNIASEVGRLNQANNAAYGASKAAVVSLTQGLGLEYAPEGIRVNSVIPGPVETDMWDAAVKSRSAAEGISPDEFRENVLRKIPLGRFPTAKDVAEAVAFMLDDERSSSIVGESLFVTGGSTVY